METHNHNQEAHQPEAVRIRAAMYVRMSTEHQQYSTENQSDVMRSYAAKRGYEIIRICADEGKSGLKMECKRRSKSVARDG